jgi:hypothetical protein
MTVRRIGAIVGAIGALAPLAALRIATSWSIRGSGSEDNGSRRLAWTMGEPTSRQAFLATLLALAIASAAAALWAARDRRVLVAAIAGGALAAPATPAVAIAAAHGDSITRASYRGIAIGTDRSVIVDRFGRPVGRATLTDNRRYPGERFDCVLYPQTREGFPYTLCFRDGRLAIKDPPR